MSLVEDKKKTKKNRDLPWQQEGGRHSNPSSRGNDVGNNQVTLHTHNHDQERNHGLKRKDQIRCRNNF